MLKNVTTDLGLELNVITFKGAQNLKELLPWKTLWMAITSLLFGAFGKMN